MKGLYKTELAILAFVAVAFGVVGNFDFADALVQEAEEKEARPARVMSMPTRETWWTVLDPSGNPATFKDCPWARLTINHDPCYSNQPCAMRRICYGDSANWVLL